MEEKLTYNFLLEAYKKDAREKTRMYFTQWRNEFEKDYKAGFPESDFVGSKNDFDWRGTREAYRTFIAYKAFEEDDELFSEEKEGDTDAHILGEGIPHGALKNERLISELVYVFWKLRNKKIIGKGVSLPKLLNAHFIDQQGKPLNKDNIKQAVHRITNGAYPRKKEELDELIDRVVRANQEGRSPLIK